VHRYGPSGPARILALHGLTGHGQRWQQLSGLLPEFGLAAPDLIGHGRSSWAAPWTIDANIAALAALLDGQADTPVLVVGHSFGAGLAMQLAAARPNQVAGAETSAGVTVREMLNDDHGCRGLHQRGGGAGPGNHPAAAPGPAPPVTSG